MRRAPSSPVPPSHSIDKETNRTLETVTNENGVYVFNALAAAPLHADVELAGFKKAVLDDVQIIAEQANTFDVELEVGGSERRRSTSAPRRR